MKALNIILVSECGHECAIPVTVLAASSPVWAERLLITEPDDEDVKSYEHASLIEVDAFVGVCTLLTPLPTMPSLMMRPRLGSTSASMDLRRLTKALSLCHKYDCCGLVKLIAHLADFHFPHCALPGPIEKLPKGKGEEAQTPLAIAGWLTQSHFDYIVRAQELYDAKDMLNESALALVAHSLTNGLQWSACTRYANGLHFTHGRVAVVDHRAARPLGKGELAAVESGSHAKAPTPTEAGEGVVEAFDPSSTARYSSDVSANCVYRTSYDPLSASLHLFLEPLILERGALTLKTMLSLLPHVKPAVDLHVAARPEDKSNEQGLDGADHEQDSLAGL